MIDRANGDARRTDRTLLPGFNFRFNNESHNILAFGVHLNSQLGSDTPRNEAISWQNNNRDDRIHYSASRHIWRQELYLVDLEHNFRENLIQILHEMLSHVSYFTLKERYVGVRRSLTLPPTPSPRDSAKRPCRSRLSQTNAANDCQTGREHLHVCAIRPSSLRVVLL
jgi:hypothetical protein